MLNIEANASPQLTSKTPYDYPATINIIPSIERKVNSLDNQKKKRAKIVSESWDPISQHYNKPSP